MSVRHNPESLLSLGTSFQAFQAVYESVRLGLFDLVVDAPLTAAAIARRLRLSAPALARLLRALVAMGLLRFRRGLYTTTVFARQYLCARSRTYIGDFIVHRETLMQPWAGLRLSLAHNRMVMPGPERLDRYPQQLRKFMSAMDALGRLKSRLIEARIDSSRYTAMLDLGGGMGTYAVSFARKNKKLRATLFDLKNVIPFARRHIRRSGLENRIQTAPGQCLQDPLPGGPFDLVFISNLLHMYDARGCSTIIRKAARVLAAGGAMVVHDYLFGCGDPVAVSLFDMTMLVGTPRGRCYEKKDVAHWLKAAGIKKIKTSEILGGTSIVWGVKGKA